MDKKEIKEIFESHLRTLARAAKKDCSGEELKALTEAMIMTDEVISSKRNL